MSELSSFIARGMVVLAGLAGFLPTRADTARVPSWFESVPAGPRVPHAASAVAGEWVRFTGAEAAQRAMPGQRWSVPIPGAENPGVMVIDRVASPSPGAVEMSAHLEGVPGSAVLVVVHGDRVALTVRRPAHDLVRLQPSRGGLHHLAMAASDRAPRCANGDGPGVRIDGRDAARAGRAAAPGQAAAASTLDLAFLYTQAAAAGAGGEDGLRALVALAVLESNDAYTRSEAQVRLRTVALRATDYEESGGLAIDLGRLSRLGDGFLDEAQLLRDEVGADVVCLVTEWEESNQYAGMANQLLDTSATSVARGFMACLRPYLVGNYTLPHEVGHLLGCNHDRDNAATGLDPWSHGTRITVDGEVYRTVMAYRPGLQFPHFSNPRVRYRGVATGVASGVAAADNVRTINATAPLLAAVREPARRIGFGAASIEVSETAGPLRIPLVWTGAFTGGVFRVRTRDGTARAGTDFEALDRELAWEAGQAVPAEVELTVLDNARADGPRRLTVEMVGPVTGLALGPVTSVQVSIGDDELEAAAALDTSARVVPGADYLVSTLLPQPGGVVVGGAFTQFGALRRDRLARVRSDGTVDAGFAPVVKYRVDALAELGDGRVALGGEFNTVDGVRLNHVAVVGADGRLDPTFSFDPGADLRVLALIPAGDGGMYAAGSFEMVGDTPVQRVVRLDARGGVVGEFDTSEGPEGDVHALAWDRGGPGREAGLLAAGAFRTAGGVPHRGIVRLRADGAVDPGFSAGAGLEGTARAVAVDDSGRVLVAGDFQQACGGAAGAMVRLLPGGAADPAFQRVPGANGSIFALARATGGGWWVGGAFTEIHGEPRRHVALLRDDGTVDARFDPGVGPDDWVLAVAQDETGALWIGGNFRRVCGVERGGLARLLERPPGPARFTAASHGAGGMLWRAEAAARQSYDLEMAPSLGGSWRVVEGRVANATGHLEGGRPGAAASEFLRLRRKLE